MEEQGQEVCPNTESGGQDHPIACPCFRKGWKAEQGECRRRIRKRSPLVGMELRLAPQLLLSKNMILESLAWANGLLLPQLPESDLH